MNTATPKILGTVSLCVYEGGNTKNESRCPDRARLPNWKKGFLNDTSI